MKLAVEPVAVKTAEIRNTVTVTGSDTRIKVPTYAVPVKKDLAVIIPFFNPTQSIRIIQNVLLTTNLMRAVGIPVFVAELMTGDDVAVFPEGPNNFLFRSASYMFYKENLFACVEKRLDTSYTKLLLLDSDILFEMPDWYDQLSVALESKEVIQPFESAHWLAADFRPSTSKQSVLVKHGVNTHSGFAWAFRRDWYAIAGICEHALVGGGDSLFCVRLSTGSIPQRLYRHEFSALPRIPTPAMGFLKQKVYHLFHGPLVKRQYDSRYEPFLKYLQRKGLVKISDLVLRREDGILEWLPAYRDELNILMLRYFQERNDDAIV